MPYGSTVLADTLEELGAGLGIDPAGLTATTVSWYGADAAEGRGPDHDRAGIRRAAPFHGVELR